MANRADIVVAVHLAIDREKDAAALYLQFAKAVKDPKAKDVLIRLASDEVGHLDKLERHLSSVLAGKDWVIPHAALSEAMSARLTKSMKLELPSVSDITQADEIRVLELALEREVNANLQYLAMAESAEPGEAREMFLALAKEEDLHAKILRAEVDSIGQYGFWFGMQEFTMEK